MVKKKEAKNWKYVTPDMMSEEEPDTADSGFICHRPLWRLERLNRFLEKLENRFKSKHEKSLAKPRSYGSPNNVPAPSSIPSWMTVSDSSAPGPADSEISSGESGDEN